jgi:ketosteroid isomerase-like protein
MYKWAARRLIRRNIDKLNEGDYRPALKMFAEDATLTFPGDNSWSNQYRPAGAGREASPTHLGRREIQSFLERYVSYGMQMVVEDILVNGPPWNARAAVRAHNWVPGEAGEPDRYSNRAVLFVTTRWGKIQTQEDYEDSERAAAFDLTLTVAGPTTHQEATAT